jgi:hypothetical protein
VGYRSRKEKQNIIGSLNPALWTMLPNEAFIEITCRKEACISSFFISSFPLPSLSLSQFVFETGSLHNTSNAEFTGTPGREDFLKNIETLLIKT